MKSKEIIFFILLLPVFVSAQVYYNSGSFVIKGKVKNFKEPFFDFSVTSYFESTLYSIRVLPDGSFEQQFPVQYRQTIGLFLNNDAIAFSVHDKDTVTLEWDEANFKNTFTVKGVNQPRTKELTLQSKLFVGFRKQLKHLHDTLYTDRKLTPENKFNLINDLYNKNVQAVFDSADFYSDNLNYWVTNLYFYYTNILLAHKLVPKFKLNLAFGANRKHSGYDILGASADYTRLSEVWFWNCPEYRRFFFDYVRFYKPFSEWSAVSNNTYAPFNPTLGEYYLAEANIPLITVKDWFIAQTIMFGFRDYAFADVEKVYNQAINSISSTYLKETLQQYYVAIKRLKPGNPAPGFTLKDDKGQSMSLSDFKGKVVYIDFWGVGCGPCIYDIKNSVPRLHEHYKNKDVVFINICVDSKEKEWKEALGKYKLGGVNLIAEGWPNHPVCKAYNVMGIPHYILIDKNGKIVDNNASRPSGWDLTSRNNAIDLLLK